MKQVYHVTVGGHGNNTIYKNDDDRILYLHCLESSVEKYKPEVLSFAVLTNHSHFLFFCERQIITKTLYHINRRYAYIIKNKYNISEKIFNTKPTVTLKQNNKDIKFAIRYIHRNRCGEETGSSIFTSYPLILSTFFENEESKIPEISRLLQLEGVTRYLRDYSLDFLKDILQIEKVLKFFGNNKKAAIINFIDFHSDTADPEIKTESNIINTGPEPYDDNKFVLDGLIKNEFFNSIRFKSRIYNESNKRQFLLYLNSDKKLYNLRNSIILAVIHKTGLTNNKIADVFGISRETVRKIRKSIQ